MHGQADACQSVREVEFQHENIGSEWKLGCNNSSVGSGCARKFGMRRSLPTAPGAMCGLSQCRLSTRHSHELIVSTCEIECPRMLYQSSPIWKS